MSESPRRRVLAGWMCLVGALSVTTGVGCQVDVGGQTLPSPYYQTDDIQYFPAGPEFKLSREAAALQAARQDAARRRAAGEAVGY